MELNENQNVIEINPIEPAPAPVKTGGDIAMCIIAKVLGILSFVVAIGCFITITALVVSYNLEFGLKVLDYSERARIEAAGVQYKGYAVTIIVIAIINILMAITALVLNKIESKKGFGSKLAKVFSIIALVFSGVAIGNCLINYSLFGRYEVKYVYY